MEGGKEMNDLLLGVIIGGIVGLVGSAIQGYYSLKSKREDNAAREKQQSIQIQHEKDSQILSRRIAIRSKYLEPMTSNLCSLYISITNCVRKLIEFLAPYYTGKKPEEVKVPKVDKQEFIRQMDTIKSMCNEVTDLDDKVFQGGGQLGDLVLIERLGTITRGITKLIKAYNEMYSSLLNTKAEQEFLYDFEAIMKSMDNVVLSIPSAHERIESLLSGLDEDDG